MSEIDTQVLIVGAGPVGLLGGHLLGRQGIRTLIAEKYPQRLDAPKAHALNPRSLEIFAAAGIPMERIHAIATPTAEGSHVRFIETLAANDIGALPYERQDDAVRAVTRWPLINIQQPAVEGILESSMSRVPATGIRRGLEWLRCEQDGGSVVSTLRDRTTGRDVSVRSRFLVAADGAGSTIREHADIPMEGPEALQTNMMIHFEADLRSLVRDRPAILYFIFGPRPNGVLIAYDIGHTWVLMTPSAPGETPGDYDHDRCRALIETVVGTPVPGLQVKGVRRWVMSAQVAATYQRGNIFLAGDAAHRFPPTGGLGLNTGIADIDNLAWKLTAVDKGWATPGLLQSYDAERRPVAQTNMTQSLMNAMRMMQLFEALGYAPGIPADPEVFAQRLADPAARAKVDAAIAFQKDHFDSLRLQLGYTYGANARDDAGRPISEFIPRAAVGARLPHAALRDGRSTLDLVSGASFVLLCGPACDAWRAVTDGAGAPVHIAAEGRDFDTRDAPWHATMGLLEDGAMLIRPDGHILALFTECTQAARAAVRDTIRAYLMPSATPQAGS